MKKNLLSAACLAVFCACAEPWFDAGIANYPAWPTDGSALEVAVSASSNVIFVASSVPLTTSLSHAPDASTSITTRPVSGTSVSVSVPTVPTPAG